MNLMLDFETLGTSPDSIVVSLGVVAFTKGLGIVKEHEFYFDIQDQINSGRQVSASTIAWWMGQSDKARHVFHESVGPKLPMQEFLRAFTMFCGDCINIGIQKNDDSRIVMWGNGANFDVSIIEDMHKRGNVNTPWFFSDVMCFRTFDKLFKVKAGNPWLAGVQHNALDDARYQANCILKFWESKK